MGGLARLLVPGITPAHDHPFHRPVALRRPAGWLRLPLRGLTMRRASVLPSLLLLSTTLTAVETKVQSVTAADRVVVLYYGVPVSLTLASIALPESPALREQARARVQALVNGTSIAVSYEPGFGVDDLGNDRIHLRADRQLINSVLVSEGLARFQAGNSAPTASERLIASAEQQARQAKRGLWAQPEAANTTPSAAPSTATSGRQPASPAPMTGAFAAELTGRHYYPKGHKHLNSLPASNLIWYRSEDDARKAGKQPAPEERELPSDDGSLSAADAVFEVGATIYGQAVAMPATAERDHTYDQSFQVLTEAVRRYNTLVKAMPNDTALQEKLRRAMQLRYGSMKQRRA
jgi:endonuclease YncB( thermonuclease family)